MSTHALARDRCLFGASLLCLRHDNPVFRSTTRLTTFSSHRRTILAFHEPSGSAPVKRVSIGRFDYDGIFTLVNRQHDRQGEGLRTFVEERDPQHDHRGRCLMDSSTVAELGLGSWLHPSVTIWHRGGVPSGGQSGWDWIDSRQTSSYLIR